jgi:TonB family protein
LLILAPASLLCQELREPSSGSTIPLASPEEASSHLTRRIEPVYPPLARMARIQGKVVLQLTVGVDGRAVEVRTLSGHPLLLQAALDAVRQWEYKPFTENGKARETAVDVTLDFPSNRPVHPPLPFPEVKDLKAVTITLSRGSYSLKITGDGTIEYDGVGSVCVEGKHHGRISEEDVRALLQNFRTAKYFSLDDEYGGTATDSYTTVSSITIGGQKKRIEYMDGAPLELSGLEDAIDTASHSRKWVSCNAETVPALRAEGINPRTYEQANAALLVGATYYGNADAVRDLIDADTNVHVHDFNGKTPLMIAAMRGLPEMVESLLQAGANPSAPDDNGRTVLMYGASSGNADVLQELLRAGAEVNAGSKEGSKEGNTALMAAAGNPELVSILLQAGARVNALGRKKTTALLARSMGELEFEDLVMGEPHADVPDESIDRAKVVRLLLDAGSDVNAKNEDGENALFTIHDEAVRELIGTKIDIDARSKDGKTALMDTVAAKVGELLVKPGAGLDLTDPDGRTALMRGAENNYVENLKVLVEAGAKLDLQDNDGSTAVMLCAEKGLQNSVEVLLNAHANLNLRDHEGLTALGRLHRSRTNNDVGAAEKLLLAAGATD